ncbi:HPP family protein [Tamaricihabitans halophyticus]|uniref:HPP family protein n=1 Tax=Tamaricihabitans halophyticus TaxID=1262583 RepID=UPI003C79090C
MSFARTSFTAGANLERWARGPHVLVGNEPQPGRRVLRTERILLIGLVAIVSGAPLLFPSLGPTAFLVFTTPQAPAASPRNTVLGHVVGILAGARHHRTTHRCTRPQPPQLAPGRRRRGRSRSDLRGDDRTGYSTPAGRRTLRRNSLPYCSVSH